MKEFLKTFFIKYLLSFICVVGAVILALNGIDGWGWFLIIAILTIL